MVAFEFPQRSPYPQPFSSSFLAGVSLWAPVVACELVFSLPPAISSCSIPSNHFNKCKNTSTDLFIHNFLNTHMCQSLACVLWVQKWSLENSEFLVPVKHPLGHFMMEIEEEMYSHRLRSPWKAKPQSGAYMQVLCFGR